MQAALEGTKRTGIISNLGNFTGNFDGSIICVAPISMGNPIAFTIVTYNGELVISVHSRDGAGPSTELIEKVCHKIYQDFIS